MAREITFAGLSCLAKLLPVEPIVRYEHDAPGNMLHIDTMKLGGIERPAHRVMGNCWASVRVAGWEMLFVTINDHARNAFMAMHQDEKTPQAVQFLRDAVALARGSEFEGRSAAHG